MFIIRFYFKVLKWALKIMAPVIIILLPCVMVYGSINPWEPAKSELSQYDNSVVLQIGFSYLFSGDQKTSEKQYLVISSKPFKSSIVSISVSNSEPPVIQKNENGFWSVILTYLFCVGVTWWFWFRQPITRTTSTPAAGRS